MTSVAKVYLTQHSVDNLSTAKTYDDIENIARTLNDSLELYKRSKNIDIHCSNDFFKCGDIGASLEDKIINIVGDNWDYYLLAYKEMSDVVLPYVDKINSTDGIVNCINSQTLTLPRHYSFVLDDAYSWPNVVPELHTTSWSHTLSLNSTFIADNHKNSAEFILLSKKKL